MLTSRASAYVCRDRLWAVPDSGVVKRQVEPLTPATDRQRLRPHRAGSVSRVRRAFGSSGRRCGRGLARGGAPPQTEQGGDAVDRRRRDGELSRDVRQERIELRRVGTDLTLPQVVRYAQAEARKQVRGKPVVDRRILPAGVTRLLRLLEIVGQRARVDAQEPDLARLL